MSYIRCYSETVARLHCCLGVKKGTALLVGREGRSYTMTALLAGIYAKAAQQAGREGQSYTMTWFSNEM